MTLKKSLALFAMLTAASFTWAGIGIGIQAGAFSPNKGLEDNDNGLVVGADVTLKLALFGIKAEGFYVDSSGKYDILGTEFEEVELDVKHMLAADFMYYPAGMLLYFQVGVNWINFDTSSVDAFEEELDNLTEDKLGYEIGLGVTLFDKLKVQGKYMFTPGVIDGDAEEIIQGLDDTDVTGILVTVGWQF